jgi:signal transduction histidine kinase
MNISRSGFVPCITAAAALAAFAVVLVRAISAFHASVDEWAARDLSGQTELAAKVIGEHYGTGDIGRIRAFGEEHRAEGLRLTLFGRTGKPIYDSHVAVLDDHSNRPEIDAARRSGQGTALRRSASTGENTLYCARDVGGFIVRLAMRYDGLIEPVRRAHTGLLLAGFAGACGLLFIFLFTDRLAARARALARERDEKARRLAELERRAPFRRDFVANVTHEIKTPVTGILAAADMLSDILESVRARLQPRADAAKMRIVVQAPAVMPFFCDAELLEHALSNLLDNAIKYSGSPDVILSARADGTRAILAVEDHGAGIPEEHRARIFERFYRVDKDRSRTCGGTGLGLAIVKHIARLHGGEATLSTPASGGCRFEISIASQPGQGKPPPRVNATS